MLRRRSIESFVAELQRCEALGLTYLVSHPGNYIDDRASGIARNADAIIEALTRVPGRTILCMETTAGSGTAIGATFEELAELIGRDSGAAALAQSASASTPVTCTRRATIWRTRTTTCGARFDDTIGLTGSA